MIQNIAGTAKISTKIIKDGSNPGRDKFCHELEEKFYNRLKKYKRTQFDYIDKSICEILPTKLIKIEKLPADFETYRGMVSLAQEAKKTIPADIVGYILSFKTDCKKEHFGGVSIEVLMHEIHHLFNYLTHPKIPSRIYNVSKFSSEKNNYEKFFVKHFQSQMSPNKCKKETKKLLKKEKEHQIDLLQYFRYKIIDEMGAYKSGEYYANLSHTKFKGEDQENKDVFYLSDKLNGISTMLRNILNKERKNFAKKNCTMV